MIVDTSALLAVLFQEADCDQYEAAMSSAPKLQMSLANWLEAAMLVDRRGDAVARGRFDQIVDELDLRIIPISLEHAGVARAAWRDFGKGVHPAKLNYGDCFAYGTAKAEREPLLFKGEDFAQTDIEPALKA